MFSSQDSLDDRHGNAEKGLGGRAPVEIVTTGVERS